MRNSLLNASEPSGLLLHAAVAYYALAMPPLDIPDKTSFDMPLLALDPILVDSCAVGPVVWANGPGAENPVPTLQ